MPDAPEKFYIFADDRQTYGPADTELLRNWAREGLVSPQSWVYHEATDTWCRAQGLPVLNGYLACPTPPPQRLSSASGLRGSQLRRIRLFSDMTDEQAEKFVSQVEKVKVRSFAPIVKQGDHGDAMFLILEGEARVSVKIEGREDTIAMLNVGDFFGEVAMLDEGPRSADVTANKDCTLLQLSRKHLDDIMTQSPELAARFLLAMNRFLGGRLRSTNDRFSKAQHFARGAAGQITAPGTVQWKKTH